VEKTYLDIYNLQIRKDTPMPFTPGENVGPYRVLEQLGSGGMATVFKSYHPALDRYVAIKVLHPAFKADPQFFERFKREARIVAKLEHPNIIPVYDFNEHNGEPYLVMRFIEGDTLKHYMKGQPISPAEALRLIRPVGEALVYAHQQGVLHRDIKPSNIMVTKEGHVFVTDFGLARMVEAGESTLSQDMMVGTPQYISPEQAQGLKNLDGRTDIYSLGVVLYEMLAGRVPFNADTPFATIHDHIYTPLPPPSSLNPNINPDIERMLLRALAKDPNDRFATATDLLQALEKASGAQTVNVPTIAQPMPQSAPTAKKKIAPWWIWLGAAALVLCLLLGLLGGLRALQKAKSGPQPAPAEIGPDDKPIAPLPEQPKQPNNPPASDQPGQQPPPSLPEKPEQPGNPPSGGEPGQQPPPSDQPGQPSNPPSGGESEQPPPPPPGVDPNSPAYKEAAALSQQAMKAIGQNNVDKAIDLYNQAVKTMPQYLPAYFGLANAYIKKGDKQASLDTLQQAVANNPQTSEAYLRLGQDYLLNENPEAALETFTKAAELAPQTPLPYTGQAMALLTMDKTDEAKAKIDQALALDPANPETRLANAVYLFKKGERQNAIQEFNNLRKDLRVPAFVRERARQWLERLSK
jgi:serine/threonine protein kinase